MLEDDPATAFIGKYNSTVPELGDFVLLFSEARENGIRCTGSYALLAHYDSFIPDPLQDLFLASSYLLTKVLPSGMVAARVSFDSEQFPLVADHVRWVGSHTKVDEMLEEHPFLDAYRISQTSPTLKTYIRGVTRRSS